MEFFQGIKEKLQESGLKVIDFIVYGNFEKDFTNLRLQTQLRRMGFQAYHASNKILEKSRCIILKAVSRLIDYYGYSHNKARIMSWYLVAIYAIYVLANQLQKHFPQILEIAKAKFNK
jgi:hypothetical protein